MKLYRGIKSKNFEIFDSKTEKENLSTWSKILEIRSKNIFKHPDDLDDKILRAEKHGKLIHQYFTDNQSIASSYARSTNGILIEINVPKSDVLKFFKLEFQNFSKRKKSFEVVYVIDSKILSKNSKKWKLKISVE